MARVTVEDCLKNVKNRFELVMLASKRARQLMRGSAEPKVAWENDKPTVVALREIAKGFTDFSDAHHADMRPQTTGYSEDEEGDDHDHTLIPKMVAEDSLTSDDAEIAVEDDAIAIKQEASITNHPTELE